MGMMGCYGASVTMACCGGPAGEHRPDCEDALDAQREADGYRRCASCGEWYVGTDAEECDDCIAVFVREANETYTAAREGHRG